MILLFIVPSDRVIKPARKSTVFQAGDESTGPCLGLVGGNMLTGHVVLSYATYIRDEYIHEQQTVHHILYHIIFCPKRRCKILVGPVRDRFEQITREVADENAWKIVELAIQPDLY